MNFSTVFKNSTIFASLLCPDSLFPKIYLNYSSISAISAVLNRDFRAFEHPVSLSDEYEDVYTLDYCS